MNVNDEIKKIDGVIDCYYDFDKLCLNIYYDFKFDLFQIKVKVLNLVDGLFLYRAIEKHNYFGV